MEEVVIQNSFPISEENLRNRVQHDRYQGIKTKSINIDDIDKY